MVTDSFGTNSSKPVEISITLVNDRSPNISLPEDNVMFIEDSGQVQLFVTAPNITDPDDNPQQRSVIHSAYICLYYHNVAFEWLSFNSSPLHDNIMGYFDRNTLHLSGNGTVDQYEEVCCYCQTNSSSHSYMCLLRLTLSSLILYVCMCSI